MLAGMRVTPAASRIVPNPREGGEGEFLDALESVSRGIQDPAAKLRFIRRSLGRYKKAGRALDLVPVPPLRRWAFRRLSLEGLRFLISSDSLGVNVAVDTRTRGALALNRAMTASAALLLVVLVGGVSYGVWSARPSAAPVLAAEGRALQTP
jgi:hypothetical protein